MTSDMMLFHFVVMHDSTYHEKMKVRLNGKPSNSVIHLRENILLISHQERDLRVWDLESEENGTISLHSSKGYDADEAIICVDYCKRRGMISAGTTKGKVANWKRRVGELSMENTWRLQNSNQVGGQITSLEWSPIYSALAVYSDHQLTILQDENIIAFKVAAIQNGPSSFTLANVETAVNQDLKLDFCVKGISLQEKQLVVWSIDTVTTFDVQSSLATIQSSSFTCNALDVVIYHQTLYCIEGDKINVRTLQGTIRQILSLPEMEGDPIQMHSNREWLAIATSTGFLRIYNISGREARQEYHSKYIIEALDEFHRFSSMKMNISGNRVACTYYATPLKIGEHLLVWDAEGDIVVHFSFTLGMTDQQQYEAEAELASSQGRPVTAAARFVIIRLDVDDMMLTMFVTSEHGIQLQDLIHKSHASDLFIGVSVPHLYFTKKMEFDEEEVRGEKTIGRFLIARTLREFSGVESCDSATRKGMMDFCYYLTIGHMDEAFKAIRFIKSVRSGRLDVAAVCLGRMRDARGARALRRARDAGNDKLQRAALAVELGMLDEAEAVYISEGRYDMVNKIHQSQNAWNQKSGTHHFEVPRMFADNPKILESYVRRKREPELHAWWARYLESIGELDGAVVFYTAAKDIMSLVRIKCSQGLLDEACSIALDTNDRAACYHLARIYEAQRDYSKAVDFYTKAHAYNSAVRLVKEHDMRDLLANLCLLAGGSEIVEAARYFEDIPGYAHQAVMLYHKAGMVGRALDLAFRAEQFSALDLVTKDLNADCDPSVLKRAAEFFAINQNYEKAVELLCMAKEFNGAIEMCRTRNVRLTDKVAELMTPTKETTPDETERKRLLENIAELGVQQGNYHFAAKKYTQAGEKLQALLYLCDYIELDTTDWQGNAQTIRDIETFYSKAHSYLHLASFYKSCAFASHLHYCQQFA
uniref:WD_REPEATS_REGION domain-containing protein n=1 Tax=Angiostrongylus cantonensis TaxID=6313 RepID=A0A0K0CWH2_ANGCA